MAAGELLQEMERSGAGDGLRAIARAQLAADDEDVLHERADGHHQRRRAGGVRSAL